MSVDLRLPGWSDTLAHRKLGAAKKDTGSDF